MNGKVQQIDKDKWAATINGGWWIAYGKTKDAAIKAVTKRFHDELNKYSS